MKLVIVESPAKAKTIERFLGSDYRVVASYGHIRDLPSSASEIPTNLRSKSWARLAVDTEKDFAPVYVVPKESAKRVKELRDMVRDAEELILATDEDREGESISWHLLEVLTPEVPVRRITFHEITRGAIQHALTEPRDVDRKLVRAQEARRVVDRLFGYSLSPVLWKKVRTKLSAGRVQSAALRLIVEREEERQAFRSSVYWDVEATIGSEDQSFAASLVQIGPKSLATGKDFDSSTGLLVEGADVLVLDEDAATRIAEEARHAVPWSVRRVEHKETIQRPPPPFITSTLQQAASSGLGMTPKRTMALAQRLYEGIDLGGGDREGLITYMRTDSVTLSQKALDDAGTFIRSEFGEEYHTGPAPVSHEVSDRPGISRGDSSLRNGPGPRVGSSIPREGRASPVPAHLESRRRVTDGRCAGGSHDCRLRGVARRHPAHIQGQRLGFALPRFSPDFRGGSSGRATPRSRGRRGRGR